MSSKSILVVGGGSAGWMTAAYLATIPNLEVSLVESATIPTVGVGESTIPSFVDFMQDVGMTEQDLFDHCSAVRKYGIQHNNWNGKNDQWMHMFAEDESDLPEQFDWMAKNQLPNKKYRWSYHLDATRLPAVLKRNCEDRIKHYYDDIKEVVVNNGQVERIVGEAREYTADLYIDCTGWRSLVRNALGAEYQAHEYLINDYAWCGPGEYAEGEQPLPYTQTYSMDYGWRWRVSIQHRTGNGYAFNSKMLDIDSAKQEFIDKTPGLIKDKIFLVPIHNKFNPEPWKSNVIALGLSCGFLEPLEATGLFLVHGPLTLIKRLINDPQAERKYNRIWQHIYKDIAKFLSTFYQSSQLNHTEYWQTFEKINSVSLPKEKQPLFNSYNYRILAKGMDLEIV